jgi:hypothetical protein
MLAEQDLRTLREAGINNIEMLASAAAAFLREHPIYTVLPMPNALSEQEDAFLREGGAAGVGGYNKRSAAENVAIIAGEYAQMVATSHSQRDAAKRLGVSTSRIRQRLDSGSLYAVDGPAGRVCPQFQFVDDGTLSGLETVLGVMNKDAHPVVVQRFFLTVSPDLESDTLGCALSPRDWLLTGHSPEPVKLLALEL